MKFNIEFWFRKGDEKDFDQEIIEAESFALAVEKLKAKYPQIWIYKTEMKPL